MANRHEIWELRQMQSLPLDAKIKKTQQRIKEWVDVYGEDGVYVSFSGGKDSTVLLDIVRKMYPNILAVFCNTGLELPSVREFALSQENVLEIRPNMNFREVVTKYGYPLIGKEVSRALWESRHIKTEKTGKFRLEQFQLNNGLNFYRDYSKWNFLLETPFELSHKCCGEMKKKPLHKIKDKQPITAQMADESLMRTSQWLQKGCNAFNTKNPRSNPMSFWLENDILTYIVKHDLPISKAYGEIARDYEKDGLLQGQTDLFSECGLNCNYKTTKCQRTGCCFCGFGVQHDTGRFVLLAEQEPKLCDYVMRGGAFDTDGMWKPTVDGMGYWFVLEWLNVHGNLQIGIPNKEYYLEKYQTDKTRKYLEKE